MFGINLSSTFIRNNPNLLLLADAVLEMFREVASRKLMIFFVDR